MIYGFRDQGGWEQDKTGVAGRHGLSLILADGLILPMAVARRRANSRQVVGAASRVATIQDGNHSVQPVHLSGVAEIAGGHSSCIFAT
jgi:hypothetical protein